MTTDMNEININELSSTDPTEGDYGEERIPAVIPIDIADGYRVWYSTRLGGYSDAQFGYANMSNRQEDNAERVRRNRQALDKVIGAPVRTVHQVHSQEVVFTDEVDDDEYLSELEADGMVSTQGQALGVFGADCLPVLLVDPVAGITAAAHCGRRGLMNDIIGQTVAAMEFKGAQRSRIKVTLGPCICGECYEVGTDIAMEFDKQFPGTATITRFGGAGIDLEKAALIALDRAGIVSDNLVDSLPRVAAATEYLAPDQELAQLCDTDGEGASITERFDALKNMLCTLENPLWHSYRRATLAGKTHSGRHLACVSTFSGEEL
ncbi:laccase domain-containing protein [Alloscardovia theropitheci]|uniref:Laccase domain-containing protein n=1 Tax=Alloscardovia theropitheci TaxID=2496842 RepID=A0A4R0QUM9_9BIFI|nr:polyphenol oxidase family protein [Alloscardovia theropitheci]TCD53727.1 laccase domain-containing protein [Alloscardovia theropitheci]